MRCAAVRHYRSREARRLHCTVSAPPKCRLLMLMPTHARLPVAPPSLRLLLRHVLGDVDDLQHFHQLISLAMSWLGAGKSSDGEGGDGLEMAKSGGEW